jgi:hypothetical protein
MPDYARIREKIMSEEMIGGEYFGYLRRADYLCVTKTKYNENKRRYG